VEQNIFIFIRAHLHYSTTFHDLLGAFLPCLVRPLFTAFHLIASSCLVPLVRYLAARKTRRM
jgi:hypothetical protein